MVDSEDINKLEMELEKDKQDLRKDVSEIDNKVKTVRDEFRPSTLIHKYVWRLCGAAAFAGFVVGVLGVPCEVRRAG